MLNSRWVIVEARHPAIFSKDFLWEFDKEKELQAAESLLAQTYF